MSNSLVQEKLAYFHHRSQYVVFNNQGNVKDSCHTLFQVPQSDSLYHHIPFMEAMQETFVQLPVGEDITFLCIRTTLINREGYYNLYVKRQSKNRLKWFIYDLTEFYSYLQPRQQERNDQAIAGEHLRLQQRAAALEKEFLQYRNEELHRIEQMKTAFFSQVSHEMRTPLNSIVGLAHLLSQQAPPSLQESAKAMESTAQHLATIINDVLDWGKLENNTINVNSSPFLVKSLVQKTVDAFRPACQEKNLSLITTIDQAVPDCLVGDATRVAQVLYNLLGNAVKFTHQGKIMVSVEVDAEKPAANQPSGQPVNLRFSVQDTGIGITEEEQKRIINPYIQANEKIHQRYGGTGLGLSIVQKLVESMGGTWSVSSQPQQGTTVIVNLFLSTGNMNESKPDDETPLFRSIQQVLVAEDDAINQKVVSQLLKQWGLRPTVVENGKQAIKHLQSQQYDLLILDYQMPEIDGAEVLSHLQKARIAIPVIMLSGDANNRPLPTYTESIVDTLSKPVLSPVLREKIAALDRQISYNPIDLRYLQQITDNQAELMVDLMNTFLQQAPQNIQSIQQAWQTGNGTLLQRAVHKAKAGFQYIGAARIEQLLDQLESSSDPSEEADSTESIIRQMEVLTQQALSQIQHERDQLLSRG